MSHLILIELDSEIAHQLLKSLQRLPIGAIDYLPDLIFAIEEAIDSDDG
jgi:hypothetical protein